MTSFSSNIDHIAKLDNSLAMSLSLSVNNVVLTAGSTYDVSTTLSIYNRTTSITEHKTITGTLNNTNIDTYLTSIKTQLESAYPVAITHSTSANINSVATFNVINIGLVVNNNQYYVRGLTMTISLAGVQKYNIDATLISPLELTPNMLNVTPEILASLSTLVTTTATQAGIATSQASAASASAASALNSLNTFNATYTASDVLSKIKTVDGSGSGLDADLLDGMQPSALPISTATQTALDLKAPLVSPSLVTPALGTPSSGNLENCTFPILNQNTTGTASNITGVVSGANGGTGVTNSGKTITLGGNLTTIGAFSTTLTSTAATSVTLPTSGTLATLAGTETLSNKTLIAPNIGAASATSINKVTVTAPANGSTLTIADGKTLTVNKNITLDGTDGSTISLGGNLTTSGSYPTTLTSTGNTSVTLPVSGTLATLSGSETLSNKTLIAPNLGTPLSGNLVNCTFPILNQSTTGNAATATTATTANALNSVSYQTLDAISKAQCILTGGGTISVSSNFEVLWSSRFIAINDGNGSHFSLSGYFNIDCPTSGTITGAGGHADVTATANGIPMSAWDSIYYILPIGSSHPVVPSNFRIIRNSETFVIPSSWVKICTYNGDGLYIDFANGVSLRANTSINSNLYDVLGSDVSGSVDSSTRLATPRTIAMTGDVTWTSPMFDGTSNVTAVATLSTTNADISALIV